MLPRPRYKRNHSVRQGIVIALLILTIFWFASLIWSLTGKAVLAWNVANETARQAKVLTARKESLEKSLAVLHTPRGIEAAVRTAFGVARPGEQVIIVVPSKKVEPVHQSVSWWKQVFRWVGL